MLMDGLQRISNISLLLSTQLKPNKSGMMLAILYFDSDMEFRGQDKELMLELPRM